MAPEKSPAFQFYPKDFLSDGQQAGMSIQETGAYIRLMCSCWLEGSLPNDLTRLARLAGTTFGQMRRFWPCIGACFRQLEDGRWIHPRLEKEREKQRTFRMRASAGGRAKAVLVECQTAATSVLNGCTPISSLRSPISKPSTESPASPTATTGPPVLTFPVIGKNGSEWSLTSQQIAEWAALYPGLDVLAEARKALGWVRANQRKTARGMPAFLVRWFNRAVNQRGHAQDAEAATRRAPSVEATQAYLKRLRGEAPHGE